MFLSANSIEKSELLKTIETLRKEMIQIGNKEGFSSTQTLEISQKLDTFIFKYQASNYY